MSLSPLANDRRNSRPLSDEELLDLRRKVWSDNGISLEEASRLFAINDAAEPDPQWADFFIDAMCEYLISRGEPRGYVTDADAQWLIDHIAADGVVDSYTELELLVHLFERAIEVPEILRAYALQTIERCALTGAGPTRRGGDLSPGRVDKVECDLIRRLIFASGGDGPAYVSVAEAEMLFRLKDASLGADNAPEWKTLFVQGVANHLMALKPHDIPTADEARQIAKPYSPSVAGFLTRMITEIPTLANKGDGFSDRMAEIADGNIAPTSNVYKLLHYFFHRQEILCAKHDARVAADFEITPDEQRWLDGQMNSDGKLDEFEQALADFIASDTRLHQPAQ